MIPMTLIATTTSMSVNPTPRPPRCRAGGHFDVPRTTLYRTLNDGGLGGSPRCFVPTSAACPPSSSTRLGAVTLIS